MPPSDRLSGALSIASSIMQIATPFMPGGQFAGIFSKSAAAGVGSSAATAAAGGLGASANLFNPVFPMGYIDPTPNIS